MQKSLRISLFLLLVTFSVKLVAQGNVLAPPRISVQGTLKDVNGAAVTDGEYQVKFDLYGKAVGGASKWSETAQVEVIGSIYSHYLGSNNDLEVTVFDSTLFLGITLNNVELSPRTELTYAPYTFATNTALKADKIVCSGAVGDVKFSVLNPTEFATVNGDCWIPVDGRNIVESKLQVLTDEFEIPDIGGLFLRAHEFSGGEDRDPDRTPNSDIAQVQEGAVGGHDHTFVTYTGTQKSNTPRYSNSSSQKYSEGSHSHTFDKDSGSQDAENGATIRADTYDADFANGYTKYDGEHQHRVAGTTNLSAGGSEPRPVNLNLFAYIRIN